MTANDRFRHYLIRHSQSHATYVVYGKLFTPNTPILWSEELMPAEIPTPHEMLSLTMYPGPDFNHAEYRILQSERLPRWTP